MMKIQLNESKTFKTIVKQARLFEILCYNLDYVYGCTAIQYKTRLMEEQVINGFAPSRELKKFISTAYKSDKYGKYTTSELEQMIIDQAGDISEELFTEILRKYSLMISKYIYKYQSRIVKSNLTFDEVFNTIVITLKRGIEKFDKAIGTTLTTYIHNWILVPLKDLSYVTNDTKFNLNNNIVSIDKQHFSGKDGNSTTVGDTIEDDSIEDFYSDYKKSKALNYAMTVINTLPELEKNIVKLKLGFHNDFDNINAYRASSGKIVDASIAKQYNISTPSVKHIFDRAINKIKQKMNINDLIDLV